MRIALFGSGWVQNIHAQAVRDHPEGELAAITNWREGSMQALAERFSIPRMSLRWDEIAEDDSIDAAVVATPNALHAEQAIACLRAGKHVLVEKPMATTVEECDRMIAAARESERSLMVGHCWRFHPDVIRMRDRIAGEEFGEVVKTRGYGIHVAWGPSGWFVDPALAGGGALVDMGVHAIDTARFVLGGPDVVRVEATIGTRYGSYAVDDDAILLISWSNGTNSVVEAGWWQPFGAGLEADTEIYGTKGYDRIFATEVAEGTVHDPQSMYAAQMAEFIDAIGEGRKPKPDGGDGRTVVRIVEDAYASARATPSSPTGP
jgi:predicted dehydrogenase